MKRFLSLAPCFLALGLTLLPAAKAALQLHPAASALPFSHQGPFVSTADGSVLGVEAKDALRSNDDGRTWNKTPLFADPAKFTVSNERALLRTREGVIISAWMNLAEKQAPANIRERWGRSDASVHDFILPTYTCRSIDDGKTWETPVKVNQPWCGCIHSIIQMKNGRVVLVGQEVIPAWRHATVVFVSDDLGRTWQRGDTLDYGVGNHDHAGSIEGSVVERKDGSLYMLMRTESGFLWEATSRDGLKWEGLKQTTIRSVTCCAQVTRLADGRIAMLWNAPPRHLPTSGSSRAELSLALSDDEAVTWSQPVVVAADYSGRAAYPYFYERKPGELWITTMYGDVRMKINVADVGKGKIPVFVKPRPDPAPGGVVFFGASTTAFRPGVVRQVFSERVAEKLAQHGVRVSIHNAGVGGNSSRHALERFQRDVLRHKPRVIVMQFGINDSAVDVWKSPPATAPRVPLAEYIQNFRSMIAAAQQQNAKVILMTTNPVRWTQKLKEVYGKPPYNPEAEDGFEAPNLLAYNEALRQLALELNRPLVDVHAAYPGFAAKNNTNVKDLVPDGMHPNDLGHQLVAELLTPVVIQELQSAGK